MKVLKHIALFIGSFIVAFMGWFGVIIIFGILTATQGRAVGLPGIIESQHDGVGSFETTSQNPGFTITVLITAILIHLLVAAIIRRSARKRAAREPQTYQA